MPEIIHTTNRITSRTSAIRVCYVCLLTVSSILGCFVIGRISYKEADNDTANRLTIMLRGDLSTPLDMAKTVTVPLENALRQINHIASIRSVSSENEALITLDLHRDAENYVLREVINLLRFFGLPENISYKVVEDPDKNEIIRLAFSTRDTVRSIHAYSSEIRDLLSAKFHIHESSNSIKPVTRYNFQGITHPATQLVSELKGQNRKLFYHSDRLQNATNLITQLPVQINKQSNTRINGYNSIELSLSVSPEPLVQRILLTVLLNKLTSKWNVKVTYLNDPFRSFKDAIWRSGCRFLALILLALVISHWTGSYRWIFALLFPGLVLLLLYIAQKPLTTEIIDLLEFSIISWAIISYNPLHLSNTLKALGILLITLLLISHLNVLQDVSTRISSFIILALVFALLVPLLDRSGTSIICRSDRFPGLAFISVIFLGLMWYLYETDRIPYSPIHKLLVSERSLPPDQINHHKVIRIYGTAKSFTPEIPQSLIDQLEIDLLTFKPDEFIVSKQTSREVLFTLKWDNCSESFLQQLRNNLVARFDSQQGIRWTLEGAGEYFQNDHLITPGSYNFYLSGPSYQELFETGQHIRDSLQVLPGVGRSQVNYDETSDLVYYSLDYKNLPADYPDIGTLSNLWSRLDTVELMHSPALPGVKPVSQDFTLNRMIKTAPVTRKNNRFILPVTYTFYGTEKYSRRFYQKLQDHLGKTLPYGMDVHPAEETGSNDRDSVLMFILLPAGCFILASILFAPFRWSMLNHLSSILLASLLIMNWLEYTFTHQILLLILNYMVVYITTLLSGKQAQFRTLCFLAAAQLAGLINYGTGDQLIARHFLLLLTFCLLMIQFAGHILSITCRGNGKKQLLNFFRFGMITKFFKGIS